MFKRCDSCGEPVRRYDALASFCDACQSFKQSVRSKVALAVRKGKLPPAKSLFCKYCGKDADCYDHRDYGKALDVDPVCRFCNWVLGPGEMPEAAIQKSRLTKGLIAKDYKQMIAKEEAK